MIGNKPAITDAILEQYGKQSVAGDLVKIVELVYELHDLCSSGDLAGAEGLVSARNTGTRQLTHLRRRLAAVEIEMTNCGMSVSA